MTYTSLELITKSLYTSQLISKDFQSPTESQIDTALDLLNELLTYKNVDMRFIPYYTRYEFFTITGQESYFIDNLVQVDLLTFNLDSNLRLPSQEKSRYQYYGTARLNNLTMPLALTHRVEREKGGSRIYLYPLPSGVFKIELSGKFSLQPVTLYQDLLLTFDYFYITYLRYALARSLCESYAITMPELTSQKLLEIEKQIIDPSPPDLTIKKLNYFANGNGLNWQQINIGKGMVPSGG